MRRRPRRFIVYEPVYQQGVEVTIGGGLPALTRHIRRICDPAYTHEGAIDPDGHTVSWPATNGRQGHFLYLRSWEGTIDEHGVLAHEALHYVYNVLECAGVDDEEAAAYLLGYAVREILVGLSRHRSTTMAKRKMVKPAAVKQSARDRRDDVDALRTPKARKTAKPTRRR